MNYRNDMFLVVFSQGDGHYFPLRTLNECQNPLLARDRRWGDDESDEDSTGKEIIAGLIEQPLPYSD